MCRHLTRSIQPPRADRSISDLRGSRTLPPARSDIGAYLLSYNLYCLGSGFVGIFLNLYFLTAFSYLSVLYFQLATYAVALIAYLLAGYLLTRYAPRTLYVLGLGFFVFLLADIVASSSMFSNVFVFGAVWGAATGVFFAGNNVIMYDITRGTDRTAFVATNNYLNGLVALVAPSLAGLLIQLSVGPGVSRFLWDFVVTCVLFVIAGAVLLRIRGDRRARFEYSLARTKVGAVEGYMPFRVYFVASQLFTMAFTIVLPLYVYQTSGSYLVAGLFASYLVLLSVLVNFAFRGGFRADGRVPLVGVLGVVLSPVVLITGVPAPLNAFVFGGLYTLFSTPLNNSAMVRFMGLVDRNPQVDCAAFWSNREYYLGVGRMIILTVLILALAFVVVDPSELLLLLPVLGLYSLVFLSLERPAPASPARRSPVSDPRSGPAPLLP